MALSITLPSLDGVSADVAREYIEQDDGTFRLDVTGLEDTGALKRAKDHEKKKRQAAESKVAELESQVEDLQEQITAMDGPNKGKGDDPEKTRLQRQVAQLTDEISKTKAELTGEITRLNTSSAAERIVSQLSDHPELLMPSVMNRLSVVIEDGQSVVRILDADGEESFMSEKDLVEEIRSNKKYAPIIRGSQGSGSGAPHSGSHKPGAKTKLSDYNGPERVKLQQENPAEYKRLLDLHKAGK